MRRPMQLALAALGIWLLGAVLLDAYGRRAVPDGDYDAIVVAGCRVDPSGQPSKALARRTRLAVELWQQGRAPIVLFTGGVGAFPPSEARAAADYARTLGLPEDAAHLEDRSTSTDENARYGAELLGPDARVLVVSDTYHILRAERVFGRHFATARGIGSRSIPSVRVRGALREVLAVAWYSVTGKM